MLQKNITDYNIKCNIINAARQSLFMTYFLRILAKLFIMSLMLTACNSDITLIGDTRIGMLHLVGTSASFSLDSAGVTVDKVKDHNHKVVIYAHGGSGLTYSDRARIQMMKTLGFDVVYFDAFVMNKLDATWANRNISDASKQQIIKNVFDGACEYVLTQPQYSDIVFYGQSNGGKVVILAIDKFQIHSKLKLVLAEAPASWGLPLPDYINVPTVIFWGERDNWGGWGESDLLFWRKTPVTEFEWQLKLSNSEWVEKAQQNKYPVSAIAYSESGHDFYAGNIRPVFRKMSHADLVGYLGSTREDLTKYISDIKLITSQYVP
jgi:dienelactone hydrolase